MNSVLQFNLTQHPGLYERILNFKGRDALEKIVFLHLVRRGDVVIEVGANRGLYTLLFSHLVGKGGIVHAFEPVPPTYRRLTDYVSQRKRFDNFDLVNSAVGDSVGLIELFMPGDDDGQASIAKHREGSWKDAQSVTGYQCQVMRLDDYEKTAPDSKIDFIKIDAEGAEMLVLKGASQTLKVHTPLIYVEICHSWTQAFGYAPVDILTFLQGLGYTSFYTVNETIKLIAEPEKELSVQGLTVSANMICVAQEHHRERLRLLTERYGR